MIASGPDDAPFEPPDTASPEQAFARAWLEEVVRAAWERFESEARSRGRPLWTSALAARFDALEREERPSYAAMARALDVSENAFRHALARGKERFREVLREEVAATVARGDEVDSEITDLLSDSEVTS